MLKLPTILIVDDSATARLMIKQIIEMTDIPVQAIFQAGNGRKALEVMKANPVDLVLADLNMPVMGGGEMIERMRQDPALRAIPVLVISAHPDAEQIKHLKANGVLGYLPKPYTAEGVRELIAPLLQHSASETDEVAKLRTAADDGLAAALARALETMAFIVAEPPDDKDALLPASDPYQIRLGFAGRGVAAALTLVAPPEFAELVASNCGSNDPETDARDALMELANVTCGLLLRRLDGGAVGYKLLPPISEASVLPQGPVLLHDWIAVTAEGYRVAARLTIDAPSPAYQETSS